MDTFHVADYKEDLFQTAKKIFAIDSPTGYTREAIEAIGEMARALGYSFETTAKGCGVVTVEGRDNGRTVMLSAHVDTLGAMVRSITDEGCLKFTRVGGACLPTLDGEYCRIRTREGKVYTGTILSLSPAVHVFDDAADRKRDEANMAVRIDEVVKSKDDVKALGIEAGDYICFDPKTEITESGFLKTRFIDDKGSVICLLEALKMMHDKGWKPQYRTKVFFSVYEEVGHGAAYVPEDVSEVLGVDMGCIGLDLNCTEYDVSICANDSSGPYDYEMTSRLVKLAKENGLSYAVDIYPHYGSDVSSALAGGNNIRGALIGPGVHASHGMERTHYSALEATINLILLYLDCK